MILQKILLFQGKFFHLCLIAFGSGAAVMAMELIISRILTPVFGSSTYTWGRLIGLVLTGFPPEVYSYIGLTTAEVLSLYNDYLNATTGQGNINHVLSNCN